MLVLSSPIFAPDLLTFLHQQPDGQAGAQRQRQPSSNGTGTSIQHRQAGACRDRACDGRSGGRPGQRSTTICLITDGQATIGLKLAQTRNCLDAFVRSHKIPHLIYTHLSNVVHLAKPSALMQALDLTKGAAVDARPDGRACYPLLSRDAVLLHSAQNCDWSTHLGKGLACRR